MSDETHAAWWKFWNWPWSVWGLLVVVLLALTPFAVRACFLANVPDLGEPFDVAAFVGDAIPPEENAFTDYRAAQTMRVQLIEGLRLKGVTEPANHDEVYKQGWEAADAAMRAWVDEHRAALAIWRRGSEKERALDASPATMTFSTQLAAAQELRSFVRIALVDQMRCLHEGDVDEAWKLARAGYRSGGHASHRGPLIAGLIGIALHAMSAGGMQRWAEHPAVTADQLRAGLTQIKADFALYESQSNLLRTEYLALRNSLRVPGWMDNLNSFGGDIDAIPVRVQLGFFWMVGEPELTIRLYRHIIANQTREIDQPLAMRRKLVGSGFAMLFDTDPTVARAPGELDATQIDRVVKLSIVSKMILPATKQMDISIQRFLGRQATLEVLFAAQTYRRDKGEFPENLDALVPEYLEAVPLDPCDRNGGRLLYRRDSLTKAVVWSVGEDGTDNDGTIEAEQGRPADVGFELK